MKKNILYVPKENIYLIICPICQSEFIDCGKYVTCKHGHTYDFSSVGYLNLTKRKNQSIYHKELFRARKKVIEDGFFDVLEQKIVKLICSQFRKGEKVVILDAGCGDGALYSNILSALKKENLEYNAVGIDNSKDGIAVACKSDKNVLWLVSDIAKVPMANNSVDIILNTLSPANYKEFNRLLKLDGLLVKTIPNLNYLKEIREIVGKVDYSNDKTINLFYRNTINPKSLCVSNKKVLSTTGASRELFYNMTPLTEKKKCESECIETLDTITIDFTILIGNRKTTPS